jgi:hypothetical protein
VLLRRGKEAVAPNFVIRLDGPHRELGSIVPKCIEALLHTLSWSPPYISGNRRFIQFGLSARLARLSSSSLCSHDGGKDDPSSRNSLANSASLVLERSSLFETTPMPNHAATPVNSMTLQYVVALT